MESTKEEASGGIRFGKYYIFGRLATGQRAELYLARQEGLGGFSKIVVLKCMLPHLAQDPQSRAAFLDEVRGAVPPNHPNIAQIYDIGEHDGIYYIAREYVQGHDLNEVRERLFAAEHRSLFSYELVASLIVQAATGLHYAHTAINDAGQPLQMIHRDLRPSNVLLSFSGVLKIVGFGAGLTARQDERSPRHSTRESHKYLAPEGQRGEELEQRSDLFSLGAILYDLSIERGWFRRAREEEVPPRGEEQPREANPSPRGESGHGELRPVGGEEKAEEASAPFLSPREIAPDYPEELERITQKALAYDREKRYQSADEMRHDLEEYLREQGGLYSSRRLAETLQQLFAEEYKLLRSGALHPSLEGSLLFGEETKQKIASPSLSDLRGRLGSTEVADLLQFLHASKRTGELLLLGEDEELAAQLYLEEGELIHAASAQLQGMSALMEILGRKEGSFRFVPQTRGPSRTIHHSFSFAIMEAARLRDEQAQEQGQDPEQLTASSSPTTEALQSDSFDFLSAFSPEETREPEGRKDEEKDAQSAQPDKAADNGKSERGGKAPPATKDSIRGEPAREDSARRVMWWRERAFWGWVGVLVLLLLGNGLWIALDSSRQKTSLGAANSPKGRPGSPPKKQGASPATQPTTGPAQGKKSTKGAGEGICQDGAERACYTGPPATKNVGRCRGGKQRCHKGIWSACIGEVRPGYEKCNEEDDNCNGQIDETFPRKGKLCQTRRWDCSYQGIWRCASSKTRLYCHGSQPQPPPGHRQLYLRLSPPEQTFLLRYGDKQEKATARYCLELQKRQQLILSAPGFHRCIVSLSPQMQKVQLHLKRRTPGKQAPDYCLPPPSP